MDAASLAALARMTVDDFRRGRVGTFPAALAAELTAAIEIALLTAVRAERRDCAGECTRRSELWERTADKPEATEPARLEAQHRGNEAVYLADLIATRT
jgi:hypothetical protein